MIDSIVDCEAGRRLGCATFCCRLLVRLDGESDPGGGDSAHKNCVDKAPDGFCVYLDRKTHYCKVWEKRPRVCREYNCNNDFLLQVAFRVGVKNIVQLSRDSLRTTIPKECYIRVPDCGNSNSGKPDKD